MAGKRKGKGKGKKKKVDEYQLRRSLRDQARRRELADLEDEMEKPAEDLSQYAKEVRIGGIEGGSTQSTLVIIDGKGTPLTEVKGPPTNHWALGMDETAARINAMVQRGKENLEIPESVPLDALALSLSGCEEEETNRLLANTVLQNHPNVTKVCLANSDTQGSLRTALDSCGIVLIAGTGSKGLMINADGTTFTCGGWGHIMGDEGGAYWLTHRACKYVFDDIDGLVPAPQPIDYVWSALRAFFSVKDRTNLLSHVYRNFDKSKFSKFAKEIAVGCEKEDPLCLHLMGEGGAVLAMYIVALAKKAHNTLKLAHGGLKVVCVGSVWKSWEYMKDAFLNVIHDSKEVDELTLLRLTVSAAIGASYVAAEKINWAFPKPYENNVEQFYHYKRENYVKPIPKIKSAPRLVLCNTAKGD